MNAAPWVRHFGLSRTPFAKGVTPGDLFSRRSHQEAIARINFCIDESALGVLTGEVGAGKTVALRAALTGLDRTRHRIIYLANPCVGTFGLYVTIVRGLGGEPHTWRADLIAQTAELLAGECRADHRVILVIDEAHLLEPDQLEALRMLTNSGMDASSPFVGLLVGLPGLSRRLGMGMSAALDQRIATHYVIEPMDLGESSAYIAHHLALVGRTEPLIADDAVARLHRYANGLPRALNNAVVAALIAAAGEDKDLVDDASAKRAVAELTRER